MKFSSAPAQNGALSMHRQTNERCRGQIRFINLTWFLMMAVTHMVKVDFSEILLYSIVNFEIEASDHTRNLNVNFRTPILMISPKFTCV